MPIRITNLRMPIEASQGFLDERLAAALDVLPRDISSWRILRKSLDVRDKRAIQFVYSAEVRLATDEAPVVEVPGGIDRSHAAFAKEPEESVFAVQSEAYHVVSPWKAHEPSGSQDR